MRQGRSGGGTDARFHASQIKKIFRKYIVPASCGTGIFPFFFGKPMIDVNKRLRPLPMVLGALLFFLTGCAVSPPRKPENLCAVFEEKSEWLEPAQSAEKKWGVPVWVLMAIMYKESSYEADARPRSTCLFIFPGPVLSSAYGYSQALDSTWEIYQRNTDNPDADREKFEDAVDFIGWYCHVSYIRCKIPKNDAYGQYLAYHEGQTGYNNKSYAKKTWLLRYARKVESQAMIYRQQLTDCRLY
jgi:hypothetical protein